MLLLSMQRLALIRVQEGRMKELLSVSLSSRGFIVDRWRSLFMVDSSNNEVQPNSPREFRLL